MLLFYPFPLQGQKKKCLSIAANAPISSSTSLFNPNYSNYPWGFSRIICTAFPRAGPKNSAILRLDQNKNKIPQITFMPSVLRPALAKTPFMHVCALCYTTLSGTQLPLFCPDHTPTIIIFNRRMFYPPWYKGKTGGCTVTIPEGVQNVTLPDGGRIPCTGGIAARGAPMAKGCWAFHNTGNRQAAANGRENPRAIVESRQQQIFST